jgi:valyl-tRNA synthetase
VAATQIDPTAEAQFERLQALVRAIRNARTEYKVEPQKRFAALVAAGEHTAFLTAQREILIQLARLDSAELVIADAVAPPAQAVTLVAGGVTCYLPLAGLVDLAAERTRLQKELDQVANDIARVERTLANTGFVARAPAEVVARERARLEELGQQRASLEERISSLG